MRRAQRARRLAGVRSTSRDADRAWEAGLRAFEILVGRIEGSSWSPGPGFSVGRCPPIPIPLANAVWVTADEIIDPRSLTDAVGDLAAAGLPSSVLVREGKAPRAEKVARATSREAKGRIPIMVTTPDELRQREIAGFEIVRAEDDVSLADARRMAEGGFETPPGLLAPMYDGPVLRHPAVTAFLGLVDGRPVTTAIIVREGSSVGVFNVGTPVAHRRRGYGGAITARVVADAFNEGASFAYLHASRMGEPVYRGIGFREVDAIVSFDPPATEGIERSDRVGP